ncbi:MAG: uracil-DNA glycosylase family protein [Asticcacaulis sp.]
MTLAPLLERIAACRECAQHLPLGPRPVVQASDPRAKVLIIGQAPGAKVHASGTPWDDASGRRLREWLGVDADSFYDPSLFAIVPMGFCYPGRASGGDAPPRPECAPLWHGPVLQSLPEIRLTLLIGGYAQAHYLRGRRKPTLTETVRAWREFGDYIPLVHPSPRNQGWFKHNPWFDAEVVPHLRQSVAQAMTIEERGYVRAL